MINSVGEIQVGQVWKTQSGKDVTIERIDVAWANTHGATHLAAFKWAEYPHHNPEETLVWIGGQYHLTGGAITRHRYNLVSLVSSPRKTRHVQLLLL